MVEQGLSGAVAFGAGLLSFFSPCILPMIPVYMCSLAGENVLNGQHDNSSVSRLLLLRAVAFIFGFTAVFILLGLAAGSLGNLLWDYRENIMQIGGIFVIVFGLNMLGVIRLPFLYKEKKINYRADSLSVGRSFLVGSLFSLGWTPCVGPILASILFLAGAGGSPLEGMLLLLLYALGLAIPFLLAALFVSRLTLMSSRFLRFMPYFNYLAGSLLVIMGLLLLTGVFYRLTSFMGGLG